MFATDNSDRVIPRKRASLIASLIQALLVIVVLAFSGLVIAADFNQEFISRWEGWFAPFIGVIVVGSLAASILRNRQQRKRWETLAEEMGFKVEQAKQRDFPVIQGTYRGHKIAIRQTSKQRGNNKEYFTIFACAINFPADFILTVEKRNLLNLSRKLTGDEEIDRKLTIKSSSDRLTQRLLNTPHMRQGLLELGEKAATKQLTVDKNVVQYLEKSQISDTEYMKAVLIYLVDVAVMVDNLGRAAF